ncbi:hypothetical protein K469DRAFT_711186 [Zopfia rhizophila CBS 207.26]|uniref:WW domain-containing protein n=1 Tax=Zopfia rhizophila CBS 207.26 TaxID=1314779 RepID=A0A6A6DW03_9PEZI|nr:hypothetical protein K469DRAFT_711186 [Zopfia rhizophila CBS 207.26]
MSAVRYQEIVSAIPKWLFKIPYQPQFSLEYTHKLYNGGWTRTYNPDTVGELLYTDMLAGSGERMHFRRSPILDPYTKFPPPPGWARITTDSGRIYFEHRFTGFAMYQHPSNSPQINQQWGWPPDFRNIKTKVISSLGIEGKWIFDDPSAPCLLSRDFFRLDNAGKLQANDGKLTSLYIIGGDGLDKGKAPAWIPICPEVHYYVQEVGKVCEICEPMKVRKEFDYLLCWSLYDTFKDT